MDVSAVQHKDSRRFHSKGQEAQEDASCWYCGKPGHFKRECRKKQADDKRKAGEVWGIEANVVEDASDEINAVYDEHSPTSVQWVL